MSFSIFGYDFTISECLTVICSIFLTVFYAVKTGGLKNLIKEVVHMNYKFRTLQTREEPKGQTFEKTAPVYRLNKATGELEKTDDVVVLQDVIDSGLETCLSKALDRLLPEVEQAEDIIQLDTMRDDLDYAQSVCDRAEEYKEKLGLDPSLSVSDVFAKFAEEAEKISQKIKDYQKSKSEEVKDEKTDQPQGE